MKTDTLKFDIGDWVEFSSIYRKVKLAGHKVEWQSKALSCHHVGRIVGMCKRYDGIVNRSYQCGVDDYEPGYLKITKSHLFYEVRCGWLNRPVLVKQLDLRPCQPKDKLPLLYTEQPAYTEDYRKYMRDEMQNWPRDAKGRWMKKKP